LKGRSAHHKVSTQTYIRAFCGIRTLDPSVQNIRDLDRTVTGPSIFKTYPGKEPPVPFG